MGKGDFARGDWPKALGRRPALAALLAAMLCAGCASTHAAGDPLAVGSPQRAEFAAWTQPQSWAPDSLLEIGSRAEAVYEAVRARNWSSAAQLYEGFAGGFRAASADVAEQYAYKSQLSGMLNALGASIDAQNRIYALYSANEVTRIVALMSEPLTPVVPADVELLGYYGRLLEISAEVGDLPELQAVALQVHLTWFTIRSQAAFSGELDAMDNLVYALNNAAYDSQFENLGEQLVEESHRLAQAFEDRAERTVRAF